MVASAGCAGWRTDGPANEDGENDSNVSDLENSNSESNGSESNRSGSEDSSDESEESDESSSDGGDETSEGSTDEGDESASSSDSSDASTASDDGDESDEPETESESPETASPTETETASDAPESESRTEADSDDSETDAPTATESSEPQADSSEDTDAGDSESQSTASVPSAVSGGEARHATVTRVIDGDTMEVQFANGEEDTVRLIGVDTPETTLGDVNPGEYEDIPDTPAARDHLYSWGQQASQYATDELEGQEVRVVVDSEGDRRGSYGRLLAYLYIGDENFNLALLEGGYARVYDSSFSLRDEFDNAESEARSNDVGLWNFEDDTSSSAATESDSENTSSPSDDAESDSESDSDDEIDLPPVPADGDYDCGHFETQKQAQYVLENTAGDPHRLDADDDGVACETLP